MTPQAEVGEREREVEMMNEILQKLEPFSLEAVDRILTWVQMRIEHEWDE